MSNESISGPEREVEYCSHCGTRLEHDDTSCPNCGKQITGDAEVADVVKRPLSLTLIATIWILSGLNGVSVFISVMYFGTPVRLNLVSLTIFGPTIWACLRLALAAIYIGTAFGLLTGKRWSYKLAFTAAGLGVIFGTLSIVSTPQMSMVNFELFPLIWAAIVWYYVKKPNAKKYLGVTEQIPSSESGGTYCPQCGTENEEGSTVCRNCGFSLGLEEKEGAPPELEREAPKRKRTWKIAAGVLITVTVCASVGYFLLDEDLTLKDTEDFTLTDLRGGLTLTDIIFCASESSAESIDKKPEATYKRGEKVWMYLECSGFQCKGENNGYVASFKAKLQIFDEQGTCVAEMTEPMEISEKTKLPYVFFNFWIDTHRAEEGEYTVRITVIDTVSGKSGTIEGSFFVTGW